MTDLLELSLGLDARPMQDGARVAGTALDGVTSKYLQAETASNRFGGSLREVTKAVSGTTQVAQGLGQAAKAFADFNVSAAAFATLGLGVDISKFVQDINQLGPETSRSVQTVQVLEKTFDSLGVATTAMSTKTVAATGASRGLWAAMAANPLLAVSVAIAAVAAGFALFSEKTDKAAESTARFAAETSKLNAQSRVSGAFDLNDVALSVAKRRRDRLYDIAVDIEDSRSSLTPEKFGERIGKSRYEVISDLEAYGYKPDPKKPNPGYDRLDYNDPRGFSSGLRPQQFEFGQFTIPPAAATDYLRRQYEQEGRQVSSLAGQGTDYEQRIRQERDLAKLAEVEEKKREERRQQEHALAKKNMQELIDGAERVGSALGNGIIDFATGAASAQQILKSIAMDFIRQQASSALGNLFKSGASAIFPADTGVKTVK